jgi:hypothetical protein
MVRPSVLEGRIELFAALFSRPCAAASHAPVDRNARLLCGQHAHHFGRLRARPKRRAGLQGIRAGGTADQSRHLTPALCPRSPRGMSNVNHNHFVIVDSVEYTISIRCDPQHIDAGSVGAASLVWLVAKLFDSLLDETNYRTRRLRIACIEISKILSRSANARNVYRTFICRGTYRHWQ